MSRSITSIMVALVIVTLFAVVPVTHAQAAPSGFPVGGTVVIFVPPSPLCLVPHTLIFDFKTFSPMGLAVLPGSQIYANWNLVKPMTFVLGSILPAPIPCLLPYRIFPISQIGTSL